MPSIDTVKLYCPNCGDIYSPPSSKYAEVDGAFFGTSFAPLFFQTYPELLSVPFAPGKKRASSSSSTSTDQEGMYTPETSSTDPNPNPYGGQRPALARVYEPRIYGFKVSERARSGPRMRWLRERPESHSELAEVDWKGRWKKSSGTGKNASESDQPSKGRNGRLFDDEDDEDDEESEESEEDEAAPAGQPVR